MMYVTVEPGSVSHSALMDVNVVVTTARGAHETLFAFARATGREPPELPDVSEDPIYWRVEEHTALAVSVAAPQEEHLRHARKYARGDLGPDRSFVFRGPKGALHLRAQNLALFVQIASGLDDGTWLYHLHRGDYSRWMGDAIKDPDLANDVRGVEVRADMPAHESLARVREAIERRYTLPA